MNHEGCPATVRDIMTELGCDVTVSTEPPVVRGPYTTQPFECPHGARYYVEPTGEQIARWARDGVA